MTTATNRQVFFINVGIKPVGRINMETYSGLVAIKNPEVGTLVKECVNEVLKQNFIDRDSVAYYTVNQFNNVNGVE